MTTYENYYEAKIANPDLDILVSNVGKFHAVKDSPTSHFANGWKLCNPADHCMTVEQFLKAGHKFVDGDIVLLNLERVETIGECGYKSVNFNRKCEDDNERFILRAAALEKKPKRVKVSYEKVEESIFDLRKEYDSGDLYCLGNDSKYHPCGGFVDLALGVESEALYRRVETEISERDEFIEFIKTKFNNDKRFIDKTMAEALFDAGCRFKLVEGE